MSSRVRTIADAIPLRLYVPQDGSESLPKYDLSIASDYAVVRVQEFGPMAVMPNSTSPDATVVNLDDGRRICVSVGRAAVN